MLKRIHGSSSHSNPGRQQDLLSVSRGVQVQTRTAGAGGGFFRLGQGTGVRGL
jgi:hypothetical protein